MNFLEIVQETNIFSGLQGSIDSVTSTTGLQDSLVSFVRAAYIDIQNMRDSWAWLMTSSTFQWGDLSTSQVNSEISRYLSVTHNNNLLTFYDYDSWLARSFQPSLIPSSFTIVPETNALVISPTTGIVTIGYRGVRVPELLTTNTQVPLMPSQFHMLIVYKAAMEMGSLLGNPEIRNENASRYDTMLLQLMRNQNLPRTIVRRPLV